MNEEKVAAFREYMLQLKKAAREYRLQQLAAKYRKEIEITGSPRDYEKDKERAAAQQKRWRQKNAARYAAIQKKWRLAHKKEINEAYRRYREDHREKIREYDRQYRAKVKNRKDK